jgi:molybdate transport system substrate-binding protein
MRLSSLFRPSLIGGLLASAVLVSAQADEVRVLSAGAIEPGLRAAAAAFDRETGHVTTLTFNTAPALRRRMGLGLEAGTPVPDAPFDVVIAPPAVLGEFADVGKLAEGRANVGRVGMGVTVRDGAPVPDISTPESLQQAVLAADSLVFNRASTGLYFEGLLKKMDIYTRVEGKTTRYPDGAAVLEHVIAGKGREIGFAAMTEILLYQGKGLRLVGPVPAAVQNYTAYRAAPLVSSPRPALAQQFVTFLAGPVAKPLLAAAGVTE